MPMYEQQSVTEWQRGREIAVLRGRVAALEAVAKAAQAAVAFVWSDQEADALHDALDALEEWEPET